MPWVDGSATAGTRAVESAKQPVKHLVEAIQGGPVRTVAHTRPVDVALNQSGLFQRLEVLRDGGLGERQLLHDLTA